MIRHPRPIAALGLLALSGVASAAPQVIGNHVGRSGLFPLVASPPGNSFVSAAGAGNEYTPAPGSHTEGQAALGLALFWEEQISSDNTIACATCHKFEAGGGDPRLRFPNTDLGFGSAGVVPDARDPQVRQGDTDQGPAPGHPHDRADDAQLRLRGASLVAGKRRPRASLQRPLD